ncbi:MAG: DUF4136 domain-containing protein [Bacteroidetes bacterium]|nr:DUF4136 domain-containing protein [Fibrella sp.]
METKQQVKKSRFGGWVALVLSVSALVSCRDNAIDNLAPQDSQVFITNYDRSANFSQYRTFSLPDSVIIQSNDRSRTSGSAIEQRFLTSVANALTSRGYTRVSRGQVPDLGVAVIRVNDTYTGVASIPVSPYLYDYWYGGGGFGGGFGPGFGGGFSPFYPSYYSYYQVSDNYWRVQIVDVKNGPTMGTTAPTDPGQTQLRVVYDAEIRGQGIFDDSSVDQTVNAVFSQSPYLTVNP